MNYLKEKFHRLLIDVPHIIMYEWEHHPKYKKRILKRMSHYFLIISCVFIVGSLINNRIVIPINGGTYIEGVTEQAHFLNPLYAQNESELAISSLLYSPLIQFDSRGNPIPVLVESFTEPNSETKEYTFTLRDDVYFHDGMPITSDDVVFTFDTLKKQKNAILSSTFLLNVDIIARDKKTIVFILKEPYSGLGKRISEIGIMPKHIWSLPYEEALVSSYQTQPVGSGPFEYSANSEDSLTLKRYPNFKPNPPFLSKIIFKKYEGEEQALSALSKKNINGYYVQNYRTGITLPSDVHDHLMILPRQFILYLNPKSTYFNDKYRRNVFLENINTKTVPLPNFTYKKNSFSILESLSTETNERKLRYASISPSRPTKPLSLYYLNTLELKKITDLIVQYFNTKNVPITAIPLDEISYKDIIIKQKSFDIFLGGQEFNYDSDLYAFWHSTEREFPGLNISGLGKKESDTILEQIKKEPILSKKLDLFSQYDKIVKEEALALPLFSPISAYAVDKEFSPFIDPHTLLWGRRTAWMFLWYTKSISLFTK